MASNTRRPKRRSGRPQNVELRELRQLSRNAKAEAARLLGRHRAGDITRVELHTGLKDLQSQLKSMWVFLHRAK